MKFYIIGVILVVSVLGVLFVVDEQSSTPTIQANPTRSGSSDAAFKNLKIN